MYVKGQVLPIRRGGGINQSLLRDFASFVSRGEWCHIFPEGGVWQLREGLGGRDQRVVNGNVSAFGGEQTSYNIFSEKHQARGKLKWGVGKLIAHAPKRPRVVIFAHAGMESLLPQDVDTMKTYLNIDLFGGRDRLNVFIRFGKEINFDDLIEEHEVKHGKLWEYGDNTEPKKEQWYSSNAEKILYHKIVFRIEAELERLTKDVVTTHAQKYNSV